MMPLAEVEEADGERYCLRAPGRLATGRDIVRRYGIAVERGALDRLMQPIPARRADMETAGAVAKVLDIGLNALMRSSSSADVGT